MGLCRGRAIPGRHRGGRRRSVRPGTAVAHPISAARRGLVANRIPSPILLEPSALNSKGVADIAGNVWEWTATCYVHATMSSDGALIAGSIANCGVHVVEGFHRTYMSNFIRDGKSGGGAVGTPPDNLGFRLVHERGGFLQAALRRLGLT
ncbi:SUMF1/EgtB/PvdO family nonheme iron enzyme [Mesorhizobium atlanticum]